MQLILIIQMVICISFRLFMKKLAHGTYRVTLGIKQTGNLITTKDENGEVISEDDTRKYVVYLGGIRIYNPLGKSGDQNYIASEQDVTVSEIRD